MSPNPNLNRLTEQELTRLQLLRRFGAVGGGLSLLALLAACGGGNGEQAAATGEEAATGATERATTEEEIEQLTWALPSSIRGLDPVHSNDGTTSSVLALGLQGLLVLDDDGALQPNLAVSWSQPNDVTYVYKLRQGVKWWDGTPLTTDDVVFSMGQHLDPEVNSEQASLYEQVESIKATGPSEVTIVLKRPDPLFQYVPGNDAGFIVQKKFAEQHTQDIGTPGILTMGTGPFRFTEYAPDEGVTLERNENYWGEKPPVKRLRLDFIVENATRLLAMRSGEIDGAFEVPLSQADDWESLDGAGVQFAPTGWIVLFSVDVASEPWSDIHVRRTLAYALDRMGVVSALLGGHGQPATSIVSPVQWGGLLDPAGVEELYATFSTYDFDLAKARQELVQSSVPTGFEASIQYPNSIPELGKVALALSQTLKSLEIELHVTEVTSEKWLSDIYAHEALGIQVLLFTPPAPDPATFPQLLLDSSQAAKNRFNTANYKNQRVDELLAVQRSTTDSAERAKALGEVLRIATEDLPYLPVYWPDVAAAVGDDFVYRGFNSNYYVQPWAASISPST